MFLLAAFLALSLPASALSTRAGHWSTVSCYDVSATVSNETRAQRWVHLQCEDAWAEAINTWKTIDRPAGVPFSQSLSETLNGPLFADCPAIDASACGSYSCSYFSSLNGTGGGTSYMVWKAITNVWRPFGSFGLYTTDSIRRYRSDSSVQHLNKYFVTSTLSNDTWREILVHTINTAGPILLLPFANEVLTNYVMERTTDAKDLAHVLMASTLASAAAVTINSTIGSFVASTEDVAAKGYISLAAAMGSLAARSLARFFDGSDASVDILHGFLADGKMVSYDDYLTKGDELQGYNELADYISDIFHIQTVTRVWAEANIYPFVMDAGYACGDVDPAGDYLSTDTMHQTASCFDGRLYYLVYPKGSKGDKFSAPRGIEHLSSLRQLSLATLVEGSIRTHIQNGNRTGVAAPPLNVTDPEFIAAVYEHNMTAPGYIRFPVCGPDMVRLAWHQPGGPSTATPGYPCIAPRVDDCGPSTFVGQTSEASPAVDDCLGLVRNIEGTYGRWTVENSRGAQHQIAQLGTCAFGVQGRNKRGNVSFKVGAQDVVDLIRDAVRLYGASGRVGARGHMSCRGNIKGQDVEWGLYHTKS